MAAEPREPDELSVGNVVRLAPIQRRAPAAQEIEVSFVSIALIDPARAFQAAAEVSLTKDDFYFPSHALIFEILQEFWQDNEPMTREILADTLRSRKVLDQTGGTIKGAHLTGDAFLFELESLMPTMHVAENFAAIIKEKANRRRGTTVLGTLYESGFDESIPYEEWLTSAERLALEIVKMREGKKTHSRNMRELVRLALDSFEADMANPGYIEMPSGIPSLDFYTDGFVAPETTIILASPSDGKTAIALNVAEHLAVERGKRVGIISLEMGDIQLTKRLLFSMARVNIREIKHRGYMTDDEHRSIIAASVKLSDAHIFIRDDGALTTSEISATATAWKAKHGLDILIVDHAQLARADKETEGRTSEVEQVSNAMKPIAKRLNIPLILLSQVTKDREGNYSAKNSKAIEADADNIWTISHTREKNEETGRMEIIDTKIVLAKQRDRERYVTVPLIFNERIQRFAEKIKEEQPELVDFGKLTKSRPKNNR